jgi:hypothetical protein
VPDRPLYDFEFLARDSLSPCSGKPELHEYKCVWVRSDEEITCAMITSTELEDRFYWHVRIVGDKSKLTMDAKAGFQPIDVPQYLVK